MIVFWIAAVALLLLAYVFFIPVLFGKGRPAGANRAQWNLLLYRQRQGELQDEAATPAELERLRAEAERNLLGDLETTQAAAMQAADSGKLPVMMMLVALPALAILGYLILGRPDLVGQNIQRMAASAEAPEEEKHAGDMEASISALAERMQQNPDDQQGWMLLGRSYLITGKFDQAVAAYEHAVRLAPQDLDVKSYYAEALARAQQGRADGKPMQIIEEILARDPNHKNALWMAGAVAATRKDTAKAVEYWSRLQKQFPAGGEEFKDIGRYLAQVQGLPVPAEAAPGKPAESGQAAPAATGGKSIRVKVELADAVKARVAPEDAVFIFARAAEGPPMPLAVVRKQARDLPVEVALDDSMSMMKGMTISSFERIVLGARVSRSGKPTPSPGDLQGMSQPLTLTNGQGYEVKVDQVVGQGR